VKSVGVVTCRPLPEPDPDEGLLISALEAAGLAPSLLPWNDPKANPADFGLCVLRSCWDYYLAPRKFLGWAERAAVSSRLLNPVEVVRWNLHKGYLRKLESAGVPVVPTAWMGAGDRVALEELMISRSWMDVVVKPAVGAGSHMTRRVAIAEAPGQGQRFLGEVAARGDVLIQPFLDSVLSSGERAIVWIDGEFTHQVVKRPRYHGEDEQVSAAGEPVAGDLEIAERALACVDSDLLYARVDIVDDAEGRPVISELELLEPSLFLLQHPPALERFVAAIAARF
jgi:glutathione synthase/RimK-type ligase-like ATP-grasp enzyme